MRAPDVVDAVKVVTWNKWCLRYMGLWPQSTSDSVMIPFLTYLLIHIGMAGVELIEYASDLKYVVASLTENVFLAMAVIKICVCRVSSKPMDKFLKFIEPDFCASSYKSVDEAYSFLYYNNLAKQFIKISIPMSAMTAILYYLKIFFGNLDLGTQMASMTYVTPYRTRPIIEINTESSYILVCVYQTVIIWITVFGYAAPDSFCLSMTLHVCGQLSALSSQIKNTLGNTHDARHDLRRFIVRHQELIRLAELIEDNFNIAFLLQLVTTTFLLCLTCYNALKNSETGENIFLIIYILYVTCVFGTLFTYCYVGECLINEVHIDTETESTGLGEALCSSNWYNIAPRHLKLVQVCLIRMEKPLTMTALKFCALSLGTFTGILKTSLAYLSFLRNTV